MSPVRERQARLLADSRAAEPRARLAQAVSRSDFLLRLSRRLSALQGPQRALESLTSLLVEDAVDVATVMVRTDAHEISCSAVRGEPPQGTTRLLVDGSAVFGSALRAGVPEEVVVPASGPARTAVLREWFPTAPTVAAAVDALGAEVLSVHPLSARGHTFGLLVLARASGNGFTGSTDFLVELADRVASGLDTTLLLAETRHVADVLRRALEPGELPQLPSLDLASFYRVARQSERVGGDFVDVHHQPEDDVVLVLGDVAGKGVEAAVHAQRIRNAVHTATHVDRSPDRVLELVNRVLVSELPATGEAMATAVCGRLRHQGERVRVDLANAGHPTPLVVRRDGSVRPCPGSDLLLGVDAATSYDLRTVHLDPGDTLLLYTDGITEASGPGGHYGEARLVAQLGRLRGAAPAALVESVAVAVSEHVGDGDHDDMALLAVQPVKSGR